MIVKINLSVQNVMIEWIVEMMINLEPGRIEADPERIKIGELIVLEPLNVSHLKERDVRPRQSEFRLIQEIEETLVTGQDNATEATLEAVNAHQNDWIPGDEPVGLYRIMDGDLFEIVQEAPCQSHVGHITLDRSALIGIEKVKSLLIDPMTGQRGVGHVLVLVADHVHP